MITALLTGFAARPCMRVALRYGAIAFAVLLFLLSLRRSGGRAGRPGRLALRAAVGGGGVPGADHRAEGPEHLQPLHGPPVAFARAPGQVQQLDLVLRDVPGRVLVRAQDAELKAEGFLLNSC